MYEMNLSNNAVLTMSLASVNYYFADNTEILIVFLFRLDSAVYLY